MDKHIQIDMNGVLIDSGISELIQKLWDNNIETIQCCEGGYIKEKHDDLVDGVRLTYEKDDKILNKAHIIFYNKDLEKIKEFLPKDTEFIIGDYNIENLSGWLGSFDGCWASFIHKL